MPEICLLVNSRPCLVDSQYYPSHLEKGHCHVHFLLLKRKAVKCPHSPPTPRHTIYLRCSLLCIGFYKAKEFSLGIFRVTAPLLSSTQAPKPLPSAIPRALSYLCPPLCTGIYLGSVTVYFISRTMKTTQNKGGNSIIF